MPIRNAPDPPVVAISASEWPANDWPRVTVNTPTTAEGTAMTVPTASAMCTGPLPKKPGSMMCLNTVFTSTSPHDAGVRGGGPGQVLRIGALRGGHHQPPPVYPDHVDVLPVQPGQPLGGDPALGAAHRDPAPGDVGDPVHHRHQRVHV